MNTPTLEDIRKSQADRRLAKITQEIADARVGEGHKLPPEDPDYCGDESGLTNEGRSSFAQAAIIAYAVATGSDLETCIKDMIGDLGHFCDRHGMNMHEEIENGSEMYRYETQQEGNAFEAP